MKRVATGVSVVLTSGLGGFERMVELDVRGSTSCSRLLVTIPVRAVV